MKKLSLIVIGLLLVPTLFLTSCDQGEEPEGNITPAFTILKNYMINNGYDFNKIDTSDDGGKFVAPAPASADLAAFLAKYHIVDIRGASDFAAGHIQGAINVAFTNILDEGAAAGDKPVLVVCYTGQTACYATSLMRMYGYTKTQALKWGMSGWNQATAGKWDNNTGDIAIGDPNWNTNVEPTKLRFSDPSISSLSQDGATILKSRVELVVAEGFKTANNALVLENPSNYFINNFFSATSNDYTGFGHFTGAYRVNPLLLSDNTYQHIDPVAGAKVVTYCYTGQTSAVMTAWLRVLGYDAYSLSFGMNGLYHSSDNWKSNQWGVGSSVPKDLPFAQ